MVLPICLIQPTDASLISLELHFFFWYWRLLYCHAYPSPTKYFIYHAFIDNESLHFHIFLFHIGLLSNRRIIFIIFTYYMIEAYGISFALVYFPFPRCHFQQTRDTPDATPELPTPLSWVDISPPMTFSMVEKMADDIDDDAACQQNIGAADAGIRHLRRFHLVIAAAPDITTRQHYYTCHTYFHMVVMTWVIDAAFMTLGAYVSAAAAIFTFFTPSLPSSSSSLSPRRHAAAAAFHAAYRGSCLEASFSFFSSFSCAMLYRWH